MEWLRKGLDGNGVEHSSGMDDATGGMTEDKTGGGDGAEDEDGEGDGSEDRAGEGDGAKER